MSQRFLISIRSLQRATRATACRNGYTAAYSTAVATEKEESDLYPPVKPLFPPGSWGDISRKHAWQIHDRAQEINKIPHIKRRLEALAGENVVQAFLVTPTVKRPNRLPYHQYLTKTHIEDGLPAVYDNDALTQEINSKYDTLKSCVIDSILQVHNQYIYDMRKDSMAYLAQETMSALYYGLVAAMSPDKDYLQNSQIDVRVPIDSFWLRTGFEKVRQCRKVFDKALHFHVTYKAALQIRTEQPLPQVTKDGFVILVC